MAEKVMTLDDIRTSLGGDMDAKITKALAAYKPTAPAAMKQDAAGEPSQLALQPKTVDQDGKPVAAKQAEMEAFGGGIGAAIERADVNLPFLKVAVPVGGAVVGMFLGVVVGDLVDNLVSPVQVKDGIPVIDDKGHTKPNWINPVVQVAVAGATLKYGKSVLGSTGATFLAGSILFRLVLRYTPASEWIAKIEDKLATPLADIKKTIPGMHQGSDMRALPPGSAADYAGVRSGMSIAFQR